jgi:hypothetical protein
MYRRYSGLMRWHPGYTQWFVLLVREPGSYRYKNTKIEHLVKNNRKMPNFATVYRLGWFKVYSE